MTQITRNYLTQRAIQEGIDDYCAGVPMQLCPYTRRAYKRAWLKGWHTMDREASIAIAEQATRVTIAHAYMGWLTVAA
jgi:ribosome modulation factor